MEILDNFGGLRLAHVRAPPIDSCPNLQSNRNPILARGPLSRVALLLNNRS